MQKKIYINEDNLNIIFGPGKPDDILCYEKILNLCRQKVTKYFGKTQDFAQKEEISYLTLYRVYAAFRNKLDRLRAKNVTNGKVELFFYLSQFYSYIDLAARTQVLIYKNYERKIKKNTLEFQEGVNYAEPVDNFIGHNLEDFAYYEAINAKEENTTDDEEVKEENTIENEETKEENDEEIQSFIKVDSGYELLRDKDGIYRTHNGLDNFILDRSLEVKEKEMAFEDFECKLKNHFTIREMQLMKSVYFNDDTYFNGTKKEYNEVLNSIEDKVSNKNNYVRYKVLNLLQETKRKYEQRKTTDSSN